MSDLLRPKNKKDIIVEFQLGAYYLVGEKGSYAVFRLLDLDGDLYHIQLIVSGLTAEPTPSELLSMGPIMHHVPIGIVNLLDEEVYLIAHTPLTTDDFYGYSVYLEAMGVKKIAIQKHLEQLIDLSKRSPQKMRLYQDGDVVSADYL